MGGVNAREELHVQSKVDTFGGRTKLEPHWPRSDVRTFPERVTPWAGGSDLLALEDRMTIQRRLILIAAPVVCLASTTFAELKLGTTFSNDMVVQRSKPLIVWGEAGPNAAVQIQFGPDKATAQADNAGHWNATLQALPVGGPYTASICSGSNTVRLSNILSGDVWLCSGQSNMQLGVDEDVEAAQMRAAARTLTSIRLLEIPKAGAGKPEYSYATHWQPAAGTTLEKFAAVGFHLGMALSADPKLKGVPIGLIDSSFGGTSAEGWVPTSALGEFSKDDFAPSMFGLPPGALYNHMIAALGPISLTGVVWYQGENNAGKSAVYPRVMTHLITEWRKQFHDAALPFIIVQLPPFTELYAGFPFTWVRESQATVVKQVPHTGLVVSIDTTNGFNLHPGEKGEIGRRAALQAQKLAYHEDVVADGPTLKNATIDGSTIRVTFDTHAGAVAARGGGELHGFMLAGGDGTFHYADATITNDNTVTVKCADLPSPTFVRYAWAAVPTANLVNAAGLPAGPFRTDSQPPLVPVEIKPVAPQRRVLTSTYDAVVNGDSYLVSLGAGNEQFISNNLGFMGSANFPAMFGPRPLQHAVELTAGSIRFYDSSLSLTYRFGETEIALEVDNRDSKDATTYHLRLANGVQIQHTGDGFELIRGTAHVKVHNADKVEADPNGGGNLEMTIGGHASKTLMMTFAR